MKGKTFLILLVAAGVLVAFSLLRFGEQNQTGTVKMGAKLFADLPVNQVAGITIADAENRVTLVRGEKVWQVEERNGYPADFDELRDTVVKLSRLKVGRSFSATPESLIRLSLVTPSAPDTPGAGKQIILRDQSENILADVTLGQPRETDGGGSGGQYLKKADAETIFLVDGSFRFLKTAPAQWLRKEILNVKADDVASVVCYSGDARPPVYTLKRPEKDEAPRLTPVPAGRTADPAKIDQVVDALSPLTLDDVRPAGENPPSPESESFRLVYQLYDGRQISIFPIADAGGRYTLRVSAGESEVEAGAADEPVQQDEKTGDVETQAPDTDAPAPKTARELNGELNPWVFSVKKWQFDSFITRLESLLEEVKVQEDGS
ncbi:hypothetical protein DSCA_58540 [Desulfosarcina alkanivorans]|uniref:DUF4340 domain-containing protein n=1 Tax=Desulfosarcina alkanivorans TaxID=571177 RepID=A0A5K7Z0A7_9BACT|nr:DUF4340 domain-containing protein [Desulfosarcina alkanivorans]BBO71924.1 hypothetical protein DSCA_58540 [Desulfosarcina alkanivorans]